MTPPPDGPVRLLVISGSARRGSFNAALAAQAARRARDQGAEATELDLRSLALPIYDGDLESEQGVPPGALELRRIAAAHDGLVLATPEYNGFVAPLPLNALHWLSRVAAADGQPSGTAALKGKPVALLSASTGGFGGMRGLIALRGFLSLWPGMFVIGESLSVPQAHLAFDDSGALKDAGQQKALDGVLASLIGKARALRG